ncbi:hypothetical protein LC607_06355 [Nostoc sp. CHAB 5824]|nr:hypothetical protein [Nostoc sp. CHAB 5824]
MSAVFSLPSLTGDEAMPPLLKQRTCQSRKAGASAEIASGISNAQSKVGT